MWSRKIVYAVAGALIWGVVAYTVCVVAGV